MVPLASTKRWPCRAVEVPSGRATRTEVMRSPSGARFSPVAWACSKTVRPGAFCRRSWKYRAMAGSLSQRVRNRVKPGMSG
ncbi:hypothetical protein FQZ97_876040 [compost metagenome]